MNQSEFPTLPLARLDTMWLQVAGTVCNLTCSHCFISCSPTNHSFEIMPLADITRVVDESVAWGVREFYFTGGEPFANKEILEAVDYVLARAPLSILTNGLLLDERRLTVLENIVKNRPYNFELRVSLDGTTAEMNDPIRGAGSFEKIVDAITRSFVHGFLPIVTVTQTWEEWEQVDFLERMRMLLISRGYHRPRIKILPSLKLGAEVLRKKGYADQDFVTGEMMSSYPAEQLLCSSARIATSKGYFACPILIEHGEARCGDTIEDAMRPIQLNHQACTTCYAHGAICSNFNYQVD